MTGRHLCVVPYVSFTQRNIFFQLFRRSLIYIRLRLNNSKNTFGQVKDYVSTIRHPYFQIRQGYFQIRAGYWKISGSYSKLNATYCKLRASYFQLSASKRTLLPRYHFATTSKNRINKGLLGVLWQHGSNITQKIFVFFVKMV